MIADHASQAFATLKEVKRGDVAYFHDSKHTKKYVCERKTEAKNTRQGFVLSDGTMAHCQGYSLVTVTCQDNTDQKVWVVFWRED